jgi:DNA repair protein RecO (recombination protein O)
MAFVKATEALVLRTYSLGDADKIAVFLTQRHGVVRGVAKGARKLRSKFGASLEPFTFVLLTYREKEDKELVTVQQAEILKNYFAFSSDPDTMADWAYLGELILTLAPPHEPNPKLYALAKSCMEVLAERPRRRLAIRCYFSVWLLHLSGLLPGWSVCLRCHNPLSITVGIYVDSQYRMYCVNCRPAPARPASPELYSLLTATRTSSPLQFAGLAETGGALLALDEMARKLLSAAIN